MKEVLILNLKRNGDIFTTGHIIRSYLAKYPEVRISLLVYKEFEKAALNLKGIANIYTIDRKKILTFKKNRIFSDGFALDLFQTEIEPLMSKQWDVVYNYSNDRVSTHLTSQLKNKCAKHLGIRFNNQCNIEHSNEWSILFNDVLTSVKYSPITFTDAHLNISNLTAQEDLYILKTKHEYNEATAKNFKEIRRIEETSNDIKLIGIQLCASSKHKGLSTDQLVELIDSLYMNPNYFPILLVAPTNSERNLASQINSEFNNSLVSVEADFLALNSILINLDMLITPDTAVKHLADLSNTPCIELSLGESPLFKQGTVNTNSFIITPKVTLRSFSKKDVDESMDLQAQNALISISDIIELTNQMLTGVLNNDHEFSDATSIYGVTKDQLGTRYEVRFGATPDIAEIERLMSRQLLIKKFKGQEDLSIYDNLIMTSQKTFERWLESLKVEITETSKDLLGSLRSLLQLDGSKQKNEQFVSHLSALLAYCEHESQFLAIPTLRFRARFEALNSSNMKSSAREIESLLYELKADFQHQVEIIKSATSVLRRNKDTARINSSRGNYNEL